MEIYQSDPPVSSPMTAFPVYSKPNMFATFSTNTRDNFLAMPKIH